MKLPLGVKASLVAIGISLFTLSVTFGVAELMQQRNTTIASQPQPKIDIAPQTSGDAVLVDFKMESRARCHVSIKSLTTPMCRP